MASVHRLGRPIREEVKEQGEEQEQGNEEPKYQPLNVLGGILEKGYGDGESKFKAVSLPQPSVRPFPVARHRSEGPHWTPQRKLVETVPLPEDCEVPGAEALAASAKPLVRKKKPGLQLSRWKNQHISENVEEKVSKERFDLPASVEQLLQLDDSIGKNAEVAQSRPRVTFTSPTEESAGSPKIDERSSEISDNSESYAQMSRLRSDSGASSRGKVTTTGVELARSGLERETIDAENRAAIASMSAAEVAEAQSELMSRLKPGVLDMLRKRGLKKDGHEPKQEERQKSPPVAVLGELSDDNSQNLEAETMMLERVEAGDDNGTLQESSIQDETRKETPILNEEALVSTGEGSGWSKAWTERVESVRLFRFDLEGNLVGIDIAPVTNTAGAPPDAEKLVVQSIAERDYLRSEGDPAAIGYTLKEAADLVRSTVPGHRTLALRLIAAVLENAARGLQMQEVTSFGNQGQEASKDVDWQAIWAYALGPEPGLTLTLRLALDDTHTTVVVSCVKALTAILSCSANDAIFELRETCWPRSKLLFTAPIFRRHTKQDEGFIGGGRWKYNIKATELHAFVKTASSQEEDAEGKETVGDDATLASKDCAAGLIRMGILPRIRYILEVEKLKAAEEPLLGVVVALTRHSPAAAEAVMKCPRLIDTIINRFLRTDEGLDNGGRRARAAHIKAIQLVKILSDISRLNCNHFSRSGALQLAYSELYKQGFLSQAHTRLEETVVSNLVECLRLWQTCMQYNINISLFTDIYPILCFWLSPLTIEEIRSKSSEFFLCLAQESYRLLEQLAQTLPSLHSKQEEMSDSDESHDQTWSWRVMVPLVETALGWLSMERVSAIVEQISNSQECDMHTVKLIETLASVLQFLGSVCEKVLGSKDEEDSSVAFIPTFIPRLGLLLATCKIVQYEDRGDTHVAQTEKGTNTLFRSLCSIRHDRNGEIALAATCCLQAVVRIFNIVDQVIKTARAQSTLVTKINEGTEAHTILDHGLVLSARRQFQALLESAGNEVIENASLLQSKETNGRGGPAPGLGIGWGALGGGAWSGCILLAQVTARLVTSLLEMVPLDTHRVGAESSDSGTHSVPGMGEQQYEGKTGSYTSELMWRISCGFGCVALAGPGDGDFVKEACSKLLLHPTVLAALLDTTEISLKTLHSRLAVLGISRESLSKFSHEKVSKALLQHYEQTWITQKKSKRMRSTEDINLKGILKGKKTGARLSTVQEDGVNYRASSKSTLAQEWARQRFPLPSHWLLSSLATNITQLLFKAQGGEDVVGVSTFDEVEKENMEEVVKAGLSWLLGLESLNSITCGKGNNPLRVIPLVRKVHMLSCVFVLGGDVFLQKEARAMIGALQELFGHQLDELTSSRNTDTASPKEDQDGLALDGQEQLNFERGIDGNYTSFAESLAEQFGASSFGDIVFGRQVATYLQQGVPHPIRLAVWRVVADAQALPLLPPLTQCCGQPSGYLYPFERNDEVVQAYVSAWTSGALDTAAAQRSLSFNLPLHHIAGFLFGESDMVRDSPSINKVAKTLVRSSMRKSQQQGSLIKLLNYKPSDSQSPFDKGICLDSKGLDARVSVLREACEGDRTLLTQVECLQRLATVAQ